ncbi:ATP-binding cassette domain-containing protein [Rheinheimera metallidurans]|uniref:ATP-binding cassette domain-containing protein n=1 Tax=Rheinheimera metallidurans TaxID=2925781 RepID=UPI003001BB92
MSSIVLENVSKKYYKETIIKEINLELKPGKYHLKGINGSGKTTLLSVIAGIEKPSFGRVVNSENIDFCSDKIDIPPKLTVFDSFKLYDKYNRSNTKFRDELVRLFNFENFIHHKYEDLSEGSKKKLKIILTFSGTGSWILLDEPTNALDKNSIENVKILIEESVRPLILVDHSGCCVNSLFSIIEIKEGELCIVKYQDHY